jgi:hypothetical protein
MQREVVELPDGDVAPLLPLLPGSSFVNLRPGVDEHEVPPTSVFGSLFTARGPAVPLATWTPDEGLGLQHGTGPKALERLSELGHPLPGGWRKVADHPKRGLVVQPAQETDPGSALRWLARAAALLCPLPITGPWVATVHRRGR